MLSRPTASATSSMTACGARPRCGCAPSRCLRPWCRASAPCWSASVAEPIPPVPPTPPIPRTGALGRFPALRRLGLGNRRRIPAVQQTTTMDCGAACLTMVLGYHGKQMPLAEVRQITGSGRDATNAEALLEAGRWFGLRGRGVRADTVEALGAIDPGAILHWRFNHF